MSASARLHQTSSGLPIAWTLACLLAAPAALPALDVADLPSGTQAFRNHQPLEANPLHLGLVRALVEAELANTVNVGMLEKPADKPSVSVSWPYEHAVTIHSPAGDSEVDMATLEVLDYGPGANDIGDLLIILRDAGGTRYRCEKYSPEFSDAVDAIVRLKIGK